MIMANCERCEERHDRIREGQPHWTDAILCADCVQDEAEIAHERFLEDYYGGSGYVTLDEQYQAAAKQKREMDR